MKKIIALLSVFVLAFATSCTKVEEENTTASGETTNVESTETGSTEDEIEVSYEEDIPSIADNNPVIIEGTSVVVEEEEEEEEEEFTEDAE